MTINQQQVETRKTLPPSTREQADAGVKATWVSAEKEQEDARKKDGQMGFDISPSYLPLPSCTFYPLAGNLGARCASFPP